MKALLLGLLFLSSLIAADYASADGLIHCQTPDVVDAGFALTLKSLENGEVQASELFGISLAGQELLSADPCFMVDDTEVGDRPVEFACYQPMTWDEGYLIMLAQGDDTTCFYAYVYELWIGGIRPLDLLSCYQE